MWSPRQHPARFPACGVWELEPLTLRYFLYLLLLRGRQKSKIPQDAEFIDRDGPTKLQPDR